MYVFMHWCIDRFSCTAPRVSNTLTYLLAGYTTSEIEFTGQLDRMTTRSGRNAVKAAKNLLVVNISKTRRDREPWLQLNANRKSQAASDWPSSSATSNHRKEPRWTSAAVYCSATIQVISITSPPCRRRAYVLLMLVSFFKCRPSHSTTGGRITTRIVALTPSTKKIPRLQIWRTWSSNPWDLAVHLHGWWVDVD